MRGGGPQRPVENKLRRGAGAIMLAVKGIQDFVKIYDGPKTTRVVGSGAYAIER